MTQTIDQEVFRFQISMNVTQLVQFIDRDKHFSHVEPCMFFSQNSRIVQKSSEISSWYVFLEKEKRGGKC